MTTFDRTLPPVLAQLHELRFDEHDDGEGMEFEPYEQFQSAEDNAEWIRAWTANQQLDAAEYRVFGQDGTGGLAAFWLVDADADLLAQPVVFFGSEGAAGVVACDFADYLWLLAEGIGPMEAVQYGAELAKPNGAFASFAQAHAADARKSAAEVLARARKAYPTFTDDIQALCR